LKISQHVEMPLFKPETHYGRVVSRRRRWIRAWLKKLPRKNNVHRYPGLRWMAPLTVRRPEIWGFDAVAVRKALYIGCVLAMMPTPGLQAVIAVCSAWIFRANLTVMLGTQLINNPLTMIPLYGLTWMTGTIMGDWFKRAFSLSGAGGETGAVLAMVIGGIAWGLLLAAGLDSAWRLLAWEARLLRRRRPEG
jgi:uncharacterized protein (DUF2062 family)